MSGRLGVGVLVSGQGTNLQAILDACEDPSYPAEVRVVVSNNPDAVALERARKKGIPAEVVHHAAFGSREAFEAALVARLQSHAVDLVVLAGFMRVLTPFFVRNYPMRILNIHPALLPSFPGTKAVEQAYRHGAKVTGVTVHFVDEGTDTGPIILQEAVPILEGESLEALEKRVHEVEHRLFPRAVRLYAEGKLSVVERRVLVKK